jgi:hypothetical protein
MLNLTIALEWPALLCTVLTHVPMAGSKEIDVGLDHDWSYLAGG